MVFRVFMGHTYVVCHGQSGGFEKYMIEMIQIGMIGFFIGGIGIPIGGVLVFLFHQLHKIAIPFIIAISVGLTCSIILLDLIPTSVKVDGILVTAAGLLSGFAILYMISKLIRGKHLHDETRQQVNYDKSARIIAAAIALHNLPAGIALGLSLVSVSMVSWKLSLVMAIHAIPEGIALGFPLVIVGNSLLRIFNYTLIVALPIGIGAMFGYIAGTVNDQLLSLLLTVAAGTILFVSYQEILKPAIRMIGLRKGFEGVLYGWLLGLLFLFSFHATHM